jgi:hypothetical protein
MTGKNKKRQRRKRRTDKKLKHGKEKQRKRTRITNFLLLLPHQHVGKIGIQKEIYYSILYMVRF